MLWSKNKCAQVPTSSIQTESPELEKPEDTHISDTEETIIYPGLKVVLPTVLAVCLAVFLTALVCLFHPSSYIFHSSSV